MDTKIIMTQLKPLIRKGYKAVFSKEPGKETMLHITIPGVSGTPCQGGIYHCVFQMNSYPKGPIPVHFTNENGCYKINSNLCLHGITAEFTEGTDLQSMIDILQAYMYQTFDRGGQGFHNPKLDDQQIKSYAAQSKNFVCQSCGINHTDVKFKITE